MLQCAQGLISLCMHSATACTSKRTTTADHWRTMWVSAGTALAPMFIIMCISSQVYVRNDGGCTSGEGVANRVWGHVHLCMVVLFICSTCRFGGSVKSHASWFLVCMRIYIYRCMYGCMNVWIYIHIYIYTSMYTCTNVHTHTHTHKYTHTHICLHTCIRFQHGMRNVDIHVFSGCSYVRYGMVCMQVCNICMCICIRICHVYMYVCMYAHMQVFQEDADEEQRETHAIKSLVESVQRNRYPLFRDGTLCRCSHVPSCASKVCIQYHVENAKFEGVTFVKCLVCTH